MHLHNGRKWLIKVERVVRRIIQIVFVRSAIEADLLGLQRIVRRIRLLLVLLHHPQVILLY